MIDGWIKLHRALISKAIWKKSTSDQRSVLIALLVMANHEPNQWDWGGQKFEVRAGQFVTSIASNRKAAGDGVSIQNVRSSLTRFKKLGFLTYQATKHGRLITINNWATYQDNNTTPNIEPNRRPTKGQQRANKGPTPNKKVKNERMKECKKKDLKPSSSSLQKSQLQMLTDEGVDEQTARDYLRTRRAPLTKTALAGIRREASKAGLSMQEVIKLCAERGWRGFRADWERGNTKTDDPEPYYPPPDPEQVAKKQALLDKLRAEGKY